jgi:hypothetical protein
MDCVEFYEYRTAPSLALPEGYHFRTIDDELFARCLWRDTMLSAFGTPEKFLHDGGGLCLMANDALCCEAYTAYWGAGKVDIGIVTHEQRNVSRMVRQKTQKN